MQILSMPRPMHKQVPPYPEPRIHRETTEALNRTLDHTPAKPRTKTKLSKPNPERQQQRKRSESAERTQTHGAGT